MPNDTERPHTQTSVPTPPARTTEDVPGRKREADTEQAPAREAEGERGDHMPRGADEPGAGL